MPIREAKKYGSNENHAIVKWKVKTICYVEQKRDIKQRNCRVRGKTICHEEQYSLAETPQLPPPPRIWPHIRGRHWSARTDSPPSPKWLRTRQNPHDSDRTFGSIGKSIFGSTDTIESTSNPDPEPKHRFWPAILGCLEVGSQETFSLR